MNKRFDERESGRTLDSIKYKKDCKDFICLEDGTITRDCRYCDLSLICRQVDIVGGIHVPMESNVLPIVNMATGELVEYQHFCTGMYDLRPLQERTEDPKVK